MKEMKHTGCELARTNDDADEAIDDEIELVSEPDSPLNLKDIKNATKDKERSSALSPPAPGPTEKKQVSGSQWDVAGASASS